MYIHVYVHTHKHIIVHAYMYTAALKHREKILVVYTNIQILIYVHTNKLIIVYVCSTQAPREDSSHGSLTGCRAAEDHQIC